MVFKELIFKEFGGRCGGFEGTSFFFLGGCVLKEQFPLMGRVWLC